MLSGICCPLDSRSPGRSCPSPVSSICKSHKGLRPLVVAGNTQARHRPLLRTRMGEGNPAVLPQQVLGSRELGLLSEPEAQEPGQGLSEPTQEVRSRTRQQTCPAAGTAHSSTSDSPRQPPPPGPCCARWRRRRCWW